MAAAMTQLNAKSAVDNLIAGAHTTIPPSALPMLISTAADQPSGTINLENLKVTGEGNENLFDHSATDLTRFQMPVIDDTADAQQRFSASVAGLMGVSSRFEEVDPRIAVGHTKRVGCHQGRRYSKAMEANGGRLGPGPPNVLVTDKDGNISSTGIIAEAAAANYAVLHPGYTVPIMRVDTDINSLLPLAHNYDRAIPGHTLPKKFGCYAEAVPKSFPFAKQERSTRSRATTRRRKSHRTRANRICGFLARAGSCWHPTRGTEYPRDLGSLHHVKAVPPVTERSSFYPVSRLRRGERRDGYPQALIDWYNAGADGAIDWGEDGDFEQCVAVAEKHIDDAEGFCNLRHQDATGAPPGKAKGEGEQKDALPNITTRWRQTGTNGTVLTSPVQRTGNLVAVEEQPPPR